MTTYTIGVDVGGTFTDCVAIDSSDQAVTRLKVPSTPEDPSEAVELGLSRLLHRLGGDARIDSITHGTTIGLNSIIQRSGGSVALVVSKGFPDVLEIGRSRMPNSFDLHANRDTPLVKRKLVFETTARLGSQGQQHIEADASELDDLAKRLTDAAPDIVVVNLLHGYANPEYEQAFAEAIGSRVQDLRIVSASSLWPEIREYERTVLAVMSAHIQGTMSRYFRRLASRVRGLGIEAPLYISASNGGTLSLEAAIDRPLETVLSGPASGVTAARMQYPAENLITFDMGGTSSDISIVAGGKSELTTSTHIGGFALMMPVIDVSAIGAGGGSVIWADMSGNVPALKVGPKSVGAEPGPACYGLDGSRAAVTDAYLTAGIISPDNFLGGTMKLDKQASLDALQSVGSLLVNDADQGQNSQAIADGALRLATVQMAAELQKRLAERALEARDFTLVPFGGAGPTHAVMLADELGIDRILIPDGAATFCALGAALAPLRRDFVRSIRELLSEALIVHCRETIEALAAEGDSWLQEGGEEPRSGQIQVSFDLRHPLQAYELSVEIGHFSLADQSVGAWLGNLSQEAVRERFNAEHTKRYGFVDTTAALEVSAIRVAVTGRPKSLADQAEHLRAGEDVAHTPQPGGERQVFWNGEWLPVDLYDLAAWQPGSRIDQPSVLQHADTTVFVPPQWNVEMLRNRDLLLKKGATE